MRTFWLTSAAFIISSGMAFAQTATPSPAPTGSTSGPVQTTPGMSPGKETPPAAAQTNMVTPDSTSGMSNSHAVNPGTATTPVPAATPAPATTSSSTPPASDDMKPATTTAKPKPAMPMHHYAHSMMMPSDGTPASYLHIAKDALRSHDKMRADDALSHAETLLLTRAVPQSDAGTADHSPAITSIEDARKAVRSGDMTKANSSIDTAMGEVPHDMMHHDMMHHMSHGAVTKGPAQ